MRDRRQITNYPSSSVNRPARPWASGCRSDALAAHPLAYVLTSRSSRSPTPRRSRPSRIAPASPSRTPLKSEESGESQRGVGRDAPLSKNDFVYSPGGDAYIQGKPVLAQAHGLQEFLREDFAGMHGMQGLFHSASPNGSPLFGLHGHLRPAI